MLNIVKWLNKKCNCPTFVVKDEEKEYRINNWPDGFRAVGGNGHAILFFAAIIPYAV
ncbi:hypothetical protein GCM10023313_33260 [Mucilaginibacter defluvii]|uniref:Uncharacterized protein n=1 Tax=Mucilaginibacter defluvii TaxID=1196019 RepID=A0ABP9G224_9SPHI